MQAKRVGAAERKPKMAECASLFRPTLAGSEYGTNILKAAADLAANNLASNPSDPMQILKQDIHQ
jgi:hypothetical protein